MPDEEDGASEDEVKLERASEVEEVEEEEVKSRSVPKRKAARVQPAKASPVLLRSRWPGRVIVTEDMVPSGQQYVFPQGGSTVTVADEDVEALLARRRKSGCCGAGQTEPFFELV